MSANCCVLLRILSLPYFSKHCWSASNRSPGNKPSAEWSRFLPNCPLSNMQWDWEESRNFSKYSLLQDDQVVLPLPNVGDMMKRCGSQLFSEVSWRIPRLTGGKGMEDYYGIKKQLKNLSHLCPISWATTKTLSKCFPSFIVQLEVAVHIPATGAKPTTWLLALPFFPTTYKSRLKRKIS